METKGHNEAPGSWTSPEEYYKYIWTRKQRGFNGYGLVDVRALFSDSSRRVMLMMDYHWMKNGVFVAPDISGAYKSGMNNAGFIKSGETKTFKMSAGPHDFAIFSDFHSSNIVTVIVLPDTTIKLSCGESFSGMKKMWFGLTNLLGRPNEGQLYYYIRKQEN